jgi:hypothetical protein
MMTQPNYLREKQSQLNLQKDKRVLVNVFGVVSVMGLYMRGVSAEEYVCEELVWALSAECRVPYTNNIQSGVHCT